MAGNRNSGMCSPLCSDVCAFYLPQGLTISYFTVKKSSTDILRIPCDSSNLTVFYLINCGYSLCFQLCVFGFNVTTHVV